MTQKSNTLLNSGSKKILQKDFSHLKDPVTVLVFLSDEENRPFNEFSKKLLTDLSEISDKIIPKFEKIGGELSLKYDVSRTPTLLLQPEKYNIRLTGAPAGEEARTFMLSILMASTGTTILSDASRKRLDDLKEKRNIKVFVSPTCPYCPHQTAIAIGTAIEKPDLITTEIIEIFENKDLATQYNAFSVPQVFIDDKIVGVGMQPEEVFIEEVVTASAVKIKTADFSETKEKDLLIIGAGPSGLTAAIYAGRSGLNSVVIEKANIGGQVAITPIVENYSGFTKISGKVLMDMMAQQAIQYTDIHEGEDVLEIQKIADLFEIITSKAKYSAKAILISSGAKSRKIGVPGEESLQGRGVSYCAACDGYFFKDGKKVVVVGGGNTAATEALYLKNIGVDVTLIHRKDKLRAEKFLQQSISDNNIPILWNSVVKEITGDRLVTGVIIENTIDKSTKTIPIDGIFIAIGYFPNNELALKLGIVTDAEGYIKVDSGQRTNITNIYAAGDITGGLKQITTAVGQGAIAATAIFEDISKPYWKTNSG